MDSMPIVSICLVDGSIKDTAAFKEYEKCVGGEVLLGWLSGPFDLEGVV